MTITLNSEILAGTHLFETKWKEIYAISAHSWADASSPVFINGTATGRQVADFKHCAHCAGQELIDWGDEEHVLTPIEFEPAPWDAVAKLSNLGEEISDWLLDLDEMHGIFVDLENEAGRARFVDEHSVMSHDGYEFLENAEKLWNEIKNQHSDYVDVKEVENLVDALKKSQEFYENIKIQKSS